MRTFNLLLLVLLTNFSIAAEPKPFTGKESQWNTFKRFDFKANEQNAIIIVPEKPLPGNPWIWRAEFFNAFPNADIALVKQGWHIAYLSVPNLFGSPKAMAHWEKFYDTLVNEHQLHPRPGLLGMSRGALYAMAWAELHPDRTLAVYLDNGVCDFKSWPGGKLKNLGTGNGAANEWQNVLRAFDFANDQAAIAAKSNPVDRHTAMAKAKIPLLLVYGDQDPVVPHLENSALLYERYKAAGGPVEQIVKPGQAHHPHGLSDPQPIVDFFQSSLKQAK